VTSFSIAKKATHLLQKLCSNHYENSIARYRRNFNLIIATNSLRKILLYIIVGQTQAISYKQLDNPLEQVKLFSHVTDISINMNFLPSCNDTIQQGRRMVAEDRGLG